MILCELCSKKHISTKLLRYGECNFHKIESQGSGLFAVTS